MAIENGKRTMQADLLFQIKPAVSPAPVGAANDVAKAFRPKIALQDPTALYALAAENRYWDGPDKSAPRLISPSLIDHRVKKYRRAAVALIAAGIDVAAVGVAGLTTVALLPDVAVLEVAIVASAVNAVILLVAGLLLGTYRIATLFDLRSSLSHAGKAWLILVMATPAAALALSPLWQPHTQPDIFVSLVAMMPLLLAARFFARTVGRQLLGDKPYVEIMIEDGWSSALPSKAMIFNARRNDLTPDPSDIGSVSRLSELLRNVDLVTVYAHPARRAAWARTLRAFDVRVDMPAPELEELGPLGFEYRRNGWQMVVARHPLGLWQAALKRVFDLTVVLAATPILAIPMLVVALLVRLDSPGPIFFRQLRVGRGNRPFHIYKFRSMRSDRQDNSGLVSASRDDDRITPVGRWLRQTSIDELPQLINVLRGEMSLVGPAPACRGLSRRGQAVLGNR